MLWFINTYPRFCKIIFGAKTETLRADYFDRFHDVDKDYCWWEVDRNSWALLFHPINSFWCSHVLKFGNRLS